MMPVRQSIPTSFSPYQEPCFESSPPEPWPYHASHGYLYPYHPCCHNNSFHLYSGFRHPSFFTPHPTRCYGDQYMYPGMHSFYPSHRPLDHIYEFDNETAKPRSHHSYQNPMNPDQHMSYPHPILWVPPEFMRNKDLKKPHADIVKEDDHQPNAWDGCFPFDTNALSSLLENEKEKGRRHGEGERKFLFPKFWMPSYHEQIENPKGEEKMHEKKISSEHVPYTIKLVPINKPAKGGSENNLKSEESRTGSSKNENIESSGGKGRRRSPSPPKASKPVPVYLRVDPFPKKSNQSRSSSPPVSGPKENCRTLEERTGDLNASKQVEPHREKMVKVVEVKEPESRRADKNYHPKADFPMTSQLKPQKVASKIICIINDNKEGHAMVDEEMKSQGAVKPITPEASSKKKITSDEEAAEFIQSVYRGYAVRKWDSLKKLKQLSDVKKHVDDVKNRVKDLQATRPVNEKEKIVIGELIMRLLLQLDTIQGLLPFVREVRKSLAKELVMLQGTVDDISMIPSGKSTEEKVANLEEKFSEEVTEGPKMDNVVDEGRHLVLDCPSKSLGSDDAMVSSDEAAAVFETNKNVGKAGAMVEKSSCEGPGEETITVDVVKNGEIVLSEDGAVGSSPSNIVKHGSTEADAILDPGTVEAVSMTSKPEEEEEAAMVEGSSIVVDAVINKEEELELEVGVIESSTLNSRELTEAEAEAVLEQNHPDNGMAQAFNDSVCDNGRLRSAENEEIVATVNQTEDSEMVKSETVQSTDVFSEAIETSEDHQLEQSQGEVVKEERAIASHDEAKHSQPFQVEENKEGGELVDEEGETETCVCHFLPKSESTEKKMEGEEEEGNGKKVKEKEELREMMVKLMEVGKEQVTLISSLSCRVKELEKELKKTKKKKRMLLSKLTPNRMAVVY